ncbi:MULTISPECIES: VOC family protein [unclassified Caulobacter]|uniref:VOC family protein n=1 Tax=unclassified Caulobacter TaxID=2648921 RepID=UPI000D354E90|nr:MULTISPECIES: VOC family protein [unclassified Caulobacter]PTS91179.1 glyoxalase/bleomycin resistance/extradiol dioxygenase family protein [Caulobacter sp. HMWF009]PTT11892.1 glyoxalase/bleomycin resistance/extradiol dioxygenase family protein [Caulobacter sp. HMWF025]
MFDHLGFGVTDFQRAVDFYDRALAPLGIKRLYTVPPEHSGGVEATGYGVTRPQFWISGGGDTFGRLHVCFAASSRAMVEAFHAEALAAGGRDNGPPGLRPHYHPDYYGAFVLDPDGFNVEAVCHTPA